MATQHRNLYACLLGLAVGAAIARPASAQVLIQPAPAPTAQPGAAMPAAPAPVVATPASPSGAGVSGGQKAAQMVDLSPDNWAYPAIEILMDRYHIMGGFPDHTFRGNATVDRYELAAMLARVMQRMEALGPSRVNASDIDLVNRLKDQFNSELAVLRQDHDDLQLIKQKLGLTGAASGSAASGSVALPLNLPKPASAFPSTHLAGHMETDIMQDPQTVLFPYWVSSARLAIAGKLSSNMSANFALNGGYKAKQTSVPPPIAGGGKLPDGSVGLSGAAGITAHYKSGITATTKFGSFALGSMMNLKGFAGHWGDGIIGSGLDGPAANPVRGGRDEALAGKIDMKGFSAAAGVTSQFAEAYTGYSGPWGDANLMGDVDHDSIGGVTISGARAYDLAGSLDLGSNLAALMVQAGVSGSGRFLQDTYQPLAAFQALLNLQTLGKTLPAIEMVAGAGYKQSPSNQPSVEQIQPAAYVFVPALRPGFPTFLAGLTEPLTLANAAPNGKTGEGSVMGDKAGWTVQVVYDNPILPNLTLEADLQQDVLFGATYDGWGYAVSSSVDF